MTTDVRRLAVGLFALDTRLEKLDAKVEKLDAKIEKLNTEVDKLGRAFEGPEGGKVDETDLKNVLRSSMAQIRKENEEHRVRTDDRYLDFIRVSGAS